MHKKMASFLLAFLLSCSYVYSASYDYVSTVSDAESRGFLKGLVGKDVWYDKNSKTQLVTPSMLRRKCEPNIDEGFKTLMNLDHLVISCIDVETGKVELTKDNGEVFYWHPNSDIAFSVDVEKHTPAQCVAHLIQYLFYFKNPYKAHPNWSKNSWLLIKQQRINIGFNKDMVLMSWGSPSDINKTITKSIIHEQWVYPNYTYVYFDNGKVTAIQN